LVGRPIGTPKYAALRPLFQLISDSEH
jgi:hypothetical protein